MENTKKLTNFMQNILPQVVERIKNAEFHYTLPEVVVEETDPAIGKEAGRRFRQQVISNSPLYGNDFSTYDPNYREHLRDERAKAIVDSTMLRFARGDFEDAILANEEIENLDNLGTIGCIGSATYPYAKLLGPELQYWNNAKLYLDTKAGKSPYKFVYSGLQAFAGLPQEEFNKLQVGDLLSHLDSDEVTPSSHGHMQMITGINRDPDGNVVSIDLTEDQAGMPEPGFIRTKTVPVNDLWDIYDADPHNVVYRVSPEWLQKKTEKQNKAKSTQPTMNKNKQLKETLQNHRKQK